LVTGLFSIFVMRQFFPHYKQYQDRFQAMQSIHASAFDSEIVPFKPGIKEIKIQNDNNQAADVDRCITCHVAMKDPRFSDHEVDVDLLGNIRYDKLGDVCLRENPTALWPFLDRLKSGDEAVDPPFEKADIDKLYTIERSGKAYDVKKALSMHPLLSGETYPFEFHRMEDYGCVICHNGNGRSVLEDRAHGPVFDGEYETHEPHTFHHEGEHNFAAGYNAKPGERLLFQTTPLYVDSLVYSSCVQCHAPLSDNEKEVDLAQRQTRLDETINNDVNAIALLQKIAQGISEFGFNGLKIHLQNEQKRYDLTTEDINRVKRSIDYLTRIEYLSRGKDQIDDYALQYVNDERSRMGDKTVSTTPIVFSSTTDNVQSITTPYETGESLFVQQACYACHKINGFSRALIGPELTDVGNQYPWYVKESILYPQKNMASSSMPNFHLHSDSVELLMSYLMAQRGQIPYLSDVEYDRYINKWLQGNIMPWEMDVEYDDTNVNERGLEIYAVQGCASCHQVKANPSPVQWKKGGYETFKRLSSDIDDGSSLLEFVRKYKDELSDWFSTNDQSIYKALFEKHPNVYQHINPIFMDAEQLITPEIENHTELRDRLYRTQDAWVGLHGFGRAIGPNLHYTGVQRSQQWLLAHFKAPSAYLAKSLMPAFGYPDSRFECLTTFLQNQAQINKSIFHTMWSENNHDPEFAYNELCSICHGDQLYGDGKIKQWIYPVPKNLRNDTFLRGLTYDQAVHSLLYGVSGGAMPAWEDVLSLNQIKDITGWIYQGSNVPYGNNEKWEYDADDIISELPTDLTKPSINTIFTEPLDIHHPLYTPERLKQGETIYQQLCYHCHGKAGGGDGPRAAELVEAKPRVLTNMSWIRSVDDVRLMSSLKYGVPGTSMRSFADDTSTEQRLWLLMYVRSLSQENVDKQRIDEQANRLYDLTNQTEKEYCVAFVKQLYIESEDPILSTIIKETFFDGSIDTWSTWSKRKGVFKRCLNKIDEQINTLSAALPPLQAVKQGADVISKQTTINTRIDKLEQVKRETWVIFMTMNQLNDGEI
jgi:mono/diheme cytochrome c family protein